MPLDAIRAIFLENGGLETEMATRMKLRVDQQGRMVIPAAVRQELGIEHGGEVTLDLDEQGVHLSSSLLALRQLQRELRRLVPEGVSLADELIAERRAEMARESEP